jgi:hypothetical protein
MTVVASFDEKGQLTAEGPKEQKKHPSNDWKSTFFYLSGWGTGIRTPIN